MSVKAYRLNPAQALRLAVCLGYDEAYYYYTIINPAHFDVEEFMNDVRTHEPASLCILMYQSSVLANEKSGSRLSQMSTLQSMFVSLL